MRGRRVSRRQLLAIALVSAALTGACSPQFNRTTASSDNVAAPPAPVPTYNINFNSGSVGGGTKGTATNFTIQAAGFGVYDSSSAIGPTGSNPYGMYTVGTSGNFKVQAGFVGQVFGH